MRLDFKKSQFYKTGDHADMFILAENTQIL